MTFLGEWVLGWYIELNISMRTIKGLNRETFLRVWTLGFGITSILVKINI